MKTLDLHTNTVLSTFDYDGNNDLVSVTDRFGNALFIKRSGDMPTAIISPDGLRTELTLDNDRNLTHLTYPDGSVYQFEYTAGGLMTAKVEPEGNRFDHDFDTNGRAVGMWDDDVDSFTYAGNTEAYTYDKDGLLTGSGQFTITRNASNGLPESVADSGFNLSRTYNGYGEVQAHTSTAGGQGVCSWDLTFNNNGQISAKTETVGGVTSNYSYTYDEMGRVLTVSKDGTPVEEYQYNANGSRIYEVNTQRGIDGRDLTYSDGDHLLTAGSVTYEYNLDGFLLSKTNGSEVTSYDYSSRGELLSVTLSDGTYIEYEHDPMGRRIAKKKNGVVVEKYLWQGMTQLLAVYDGSDNLVMRFEYADARMPVAMVKEGVRYYLDYDQVGTLRAVADSAGNIVKQIDYDTFGCKIGDTNPVFTVPFAFAGGLHDRDTDLVRFGYRDYDPDTGRWTAKDPIGFAGGDTDLFGYCLNDPVNWIDPEGLQSAAPAVPGMPLFPPVLPPVFIPGTPENDMFVDDVMDIIDGIGDFFGDDYDISACPPAYEARKKYKKPENPNKRKGADDRKKSGDRERNVGHPDGEEHSRVPKEGVRRR